MDGKSTASDHTIALAAAISVFAATAIATFLMLMLLTLLTVDSLRPVVG